MWRFFWFGRRLVFFWVQCNILSELNISFCCLQFTFRICHETSCGFVFQRRFSLILLQFSETVVFGLIVRARFSKIGYSFELNFVPGFTILEDLTVSMRFFIRQCFVFLSNKKWSFRRRVVDDRAIVCSFTSKGCLCGLHLFLPVFFWNISSRKQTECDCTYWSTPF